jgi:hypothetical protein
MATACLREPLQAFEQLERDYIAQSYDLRRGRRRSPPPTCRSASAKGWRPSTADASARC